MRNRGLVYYLLMDCLFSPMVSEGEEAAVASLGGSGSGSVVRLPSSCWQTCHGKPRKGSRLHLQEGSHTAIGWGPQFLTDCWLGGLQGTFWAPPDSTEGLSRAAGSPGVKSLWTHAGGRWSESRTEATVFSIT